MDNVWVGHPYFLRFVDLVAFLFFFVEFWGDWGWAVGDGKMLWMACVSKKLSQGCLTWQIPIEYSWDTFGVKRAIQMDNVWVGHLCFQGSVIFLMFF